MLIYWNKRKCLQRNLRLQLAQDWLVTPIWQPFHCFCYTNISRSNVRENALFQRTIELLPND